MLVVSVIAAAFTFFAVAVASFRWMFQEPGSFEESVYYSILPDILSMWRGEYLKDLVASMRLGAWLFLSALPAALVYAVLSSLAE